MSILIEINNGQPIPLMWYIYILLFFRILALENIAKILTTGPRLDSGLGLVQSLYWPFVSPAKHGLHTGIMTPGAAAALSHVWFPFDNS